MTTCLAVLSRVPAAKVVAVFAGLFYFAFGYAFATQTSVLSYINLVFQADCSRVILDMTNVDHVHWRTRVHPLHALLTSPVGVPLSGLFGSRELAAIAMTAALAAGAVWNLDTILQRTTHLSRLERTLFAVLLAASASQVTFGALPETHVASAFGISWMARHLSGRLAHRRGFGDGGGVLGFIRGSGVVPAVVAAGALVTNAVLVPVYLLLQLRRGEARTRRLLAVLAAGSAIATLLAGLHLVQREVLRSTTLADVAQHGTTVLAGGAHPPETVPAGAPAPSGASEGSLERSTMHGALKLLESELKFVLMEGRSPVERVASVVAATFALNLFAPAVHTTTVAGWDQPFAYFDYLAFDLRPPGVLGLAAWLGLLVAAPIVAGRRMRELAENPVAIFAAVTSGFYAALFCLYGDDLFLYSPSSVLPLVLLFAPVYGLAKRASLRLGRVGSVLLFASALLLSVNSYLYARDLLQVYT